MLQNKISILSTRLLDDEFILDAQSQNLSIDVVSFIKTDPVSSAESGEEISRALAGAGPIVFTSSNAIEAIASKIKDQKTPRKIFCIGYTTKRSVVKYFGEGSIAGLFLAFWTSQLS